VKIVFLNRYFYPDHSATSQLLTDLAFDLAAGGLAIHIITSRQRYDDPREVLPARESIRGVQVHRVWTLRFGRGRLIGRTFDYLTFYLSAAWRLAVLLAPGDVVVAQTDPPLVSVIAAVLARLRRGRLVNWIQDLFPEVATALGVRGIGEITAKALQYLRNKSFKQACYNVVLSGQMAQYVASLGLESKRVCIIHNWADGHLIRPILPEQNSLRRAWGLQGKFVVGYSGNMGRVHEFATILGAAKELRHDNEIVFLFIGGGAQRGWIAEEARRHGLQNLLFKPYQPRKRLAESLSVPDVHLVTLRPELEGLSVPSKFYGIAAAGRPTLFIGDPKGEIACLVRKYACGVSLVPGDSEGLIRVLYMLAAHPEYRAVLGSNARTSFAACFSKERGVGAWRALLLETMREVA
jgi:colanic acid biosynthesis glycosyl transferase WcaI